MTDPELKVVYKHIHALVGQAHGCAITESEITHEDQMRGLRVGDLCDSCRGTIRTQMIQIRTEVDAIAK